MELYRIERNIPIPRPKHGRPGSRAGVFTSPIAIAINSLGVGDSVLVPIGSSTAKKIGGLLSTIMAHAKKRKGHTFCRRSVEGGLRVWRLT